MLWKAGHAQMILAGAQHGPATSTDLHCQVMAVCLLYLTTQRWPVGCNLGVVAERLCTGHTSSGDSQRPHTKNQCIPTWLFGEAL